MITLQQLKKISPTTPDKTLYKFLPHINSKLPKYGIDSPVEKASFLAQVLHESGGFKWLKEIWGPTPAQKRYEGRVDLGNTQPGDGKKFSGRGLIQLTGRRNYELMSLELFGDKRLLETPELIEQPEYAVESACVYWKWRNLDKHDDDLLINKETRLVNGGVNGLKDRQLYFDRAIQTFIP
jgi:putative chitinase